MAATSPKTTTALQRVVEAPHGRYCRNESVTFLQLAQRCGMMQFGTPKETISIQESSKCHSAVLLVAVAAAAAAVFVCHPD
jgi:hypothetical protein